MYEQVWDLRLYGLRLPGAAISNALVNILW